jgi:multisubunit Na+/H+ antiporter MnhE subunit
MYLSKDRCELKRVKRKPFLKILADIFISRMGGVLLLWLFIILIIYLITYLMNVSQIFISALIGPFFIEPIDKIITYHMQHKNITISVSNIRKLCVNKDRKTLTIEYNDDNKRLKIKVVDMPDADRAKQYIINQLNERNLFVIDKK